jgi:gliding motility-associated-like protein
VYRSEPAAASGYVLIDSISPAPYDSLNRYIDRSDLPNGNTYCYLVEAVHASGLTSLSNAGCDTVDNPPVRYNHIRRISVDTTTGYLHLKYIFNPIEIAEYFLLQRRIADRDFATIDTFWVADLDLSSGVPTINYVDSSARPDRESYQYRMVVQDVCGISIDTSGTFSNLFLTGEVEPKIYPKSGTFLKWQVEHSWPEGIEGFELHRDDSAVNRTRAFIPVANIVSPVVRQWVDTVPQDPADVAYRALARFQYYLKAVETDPNTEDFEQEEIYSNIFRIVHPPRLFLPSAFVPGSGSNALFKPLGFFLDPNKEFKLELYNRWGQLQFETNDVFGSWDGTNMNGDPLPQDTYVYRVVFTGRDEKVYNLNSSVILIRKE